VGSVDLSPRGSFKMGSDVSSAAWMKQMDELKEELGIQ
jgi:NAD+ synthase (glutamine-hydrolysing)